VTPRVARFLGAGVLLACAAFASRVIPPVVRAAHGDYLAFSDFFAQWSFALFSRLGPVGLIYNGDELHRFQVTLEPALRQTFPFPYPPSYLFAIWPLSFLSYGAAYLAWDGATLALFLWSVFGTRVRANLFWFVLLAPTTIITLVQGQNGLLTSALVVGGMRVMRARPVLGGVLLGLATIKPQIGILVPLALLGAGYWRTLAAACATASLLAIAGGAVFGWGLWVDWLEGLSSHAAYLDVSVGNYLKPGIMANLVLFGMAVPVAHAIQAGIGVVVAAIVFLCFRRGPTDLSIAVLQAGTFLAMPYVFRYDMPMLANAILLMARDRRGSGETVNVIEAVVLFLGLMAPAITTVTTRFFYLSGLSLLLLFGLAVWWRLRSAAYRRELTGATWVRPRTGPRARPSKYPSPDARNTDNTG
jgi:hypothetical protein